MRWWAQSGIITAQGPHQSGSVEGHDHRVSKKADPRRVRISARLPATLVTCTLAR
jgi:hypothetical protein